MSVIASADANNVNVLFSESTTFENVLPVAPVVWKDQFLGKALDKTINWDVVEVNLNTAIALAADVANGAVDMIIDADNNAEDAVLYWSDQRGISLKQGAQIEFRLTLPTMTTGPTVVFGLAGDHNLVKDDITEHAWFRLNGSATLVVETDDTTNDEDDVATGKTLVAGTYNIFRIDCTDLTDVKFFFDGVQVATATPFDMSNLSNAEAVMQPYVSLDKGADTTVGTVRIDQVTTWSNAS